MISTSISPIIGKSISATVIKANEIDERTEKLFNEMVEAFNETKHWPTGHTIRLRTGKCRGNSTIISLRNYSGWIKCLVIVNGKTQYQSLFIAGYHNPETGRWTQSTNCTLPAFNQWRRKVTGEINRLERQGKL